MVDVEEEEEESPKDTSGRAGLFTPNCWEATGMLLPS